MKSLGRELSVAGATLSAIRVGFLVMAVAARESVIEEVFSVIVKGLYRQDHKREDN